MFIHPTCMHTYIHTHTQLKQQHQHNFCASCGVSRRCFYCSRHRQHGATVRNSVKLLPGAPSPQNSEFVPGVFPSDLRCSTQVCSKVCNASQQPKPLTRIVVCSPAARADGGVGPRFGFGHCLCLSVRAGVPVLNTCWGGCHFRRSTPMVSSGCRLRVSFLAGSTRNARRVRALRALRELRGPRAMRRCVRPVCAFAAQVCGGP